jgi:hypothetical protein
MEQDGMVRSEERTRTLAEIVGLPVQEGDIPGLALAFDAALTLIEDLGEIGDAASAPVAGHYDAAWGEKENRQ